VTDTVDDLFDYDQLMVEREDLHHDATEAHLAPESSERHLAQVITSEHVVNYVDSVTEWLTHQIDQLLSKVEKDQDVGMLRGFGMVKAKLQADRLNAKGVLGDER
jgi:hypothetical protein